MINKKNILYIKLGALGDVVRNLYILKVLAQENNSKITLLTSNTSIDLVKNFPFVDKVVISIEDVADELFDIIYSFDDDKSLINKLSLLNYKKIVGVYKFKDKYLYSEDSSLWFDMSLFSKYGAIKADSLKKNNKLTHTYIFSKILNIKKVKIKPCFYGDSYFEDYWKKLKHNDHFYIALNPFAGSRWPSKELDKERFDTLIDLLENFFISKKIKTKFIMFNDNSIRCKEFKGTRNNIDLWNTSTSVLSLAGAVKSCDFIITTDSLVLHLAIAQKIYNLSFFSPTSAAEIDTFNLGIKLKSLSEDYCNYKAINDNSTITSKRIFSYFKKSMNYFERTGYFEKFKKK